MYIPRHLSRSRNPGVTLVGKRALPRAFAAVLLGLTALFAAAPTLAQMRAGSYTGNGSSQAIDGLGFRPDVVFVKAEANDWGVIRTATMPFARSQDFTGTGFETGLVTSFDVDGFSVGGDERVNGSAVVYHWVAFAGFSGELAVGSYMGNGSAGRVIDISDTSFSTDFQPDFLIVITVDQDPCFRPSSLAGDGCLEFSGGGVLTNTVTALQANGFEVGGDVHVNANLWQYHYVAWKGISGSTAVGSYPGNATDDRKIIDPALDFEPEWVIVKQEFTQPAVQHSYSMGWTIDTTMTFEGAAFGAFANGIQSLKPVGCSNCFEVGDHSAVNDSGPYHFAAFRNRAPTLAVVERLEAHPTARGVEVEWQTASEVGTAGFYLYRWDSGADGYAQVNSRLLPATLAAPQGAVYRLLDEGALAASGYRYALVEVEVGGGERVHGPFRVDVGSPRTATEDDAVEPVVAPARVRQRLAARRAIEAVELHSRDSDGRDRSTGHSELEIGVREGGLFELNAVRLAASFEESPAIVRQWIARGQLALKNRGRQISWQAAPDGSALYFYGESPDDQYAPDNVYWLRQGPGARMGGWSMPPNWGDGELAAHRERLHFEQDLLPATAVVRDPESDYWFWEGVRAGDDTQGRKEFALTTPGLSPTGDEGELQIELFGVSETPAAEDHHAVVRLNDIEIGETSWDGVGRHAATFSFPVSRLQEGENRVEVEGILDGGVPYSLFFVDSFDLSYPRRYQAEGDRLTFRPDRAGSVIITGFSSPDVRVYDITRPERPRVVSVQPAAPRWTRGEPAGGSGDYSVRLAAVSPESDYLAIGVQGIASPTIRHRWIDPRSDLRSRDNRAEYIAIAPAGLRAAVETLVSHHRRHGLDARVVELEEVYRQFNHGLAAPTAIRDFLSHAYHQWSGAPRYAVLVGAGTFDYLDRLGHGGNLVPPLMVATPWGLFASDNRLADVVGDDGVPDLAIGRIPVLSGEELTSYVSKLELWESSGAGRRALLLADDADGAGDFPAASDALVELLPAAWPVERIYLSEYPVSQARELLFDQLGSGASLVNYVGHGGVSRLAHEGLLTAADLPRLREAGRSPIFTTVTCVVGRFEIPGFESLAEALVVAPEGGAIAVWAPTGLSLTGPASDLNQAFARALAVDDVVTLGDAVRSALADYAGDGSLPAILQTYGITGDPAVPVLAGAD